MRTIYLPILLTIGLLSGCGNWLAAMDRLQIWAVPDSITIFPDALAEMENEVFSGSNQTILLESAINETVSFQLVFKAGQSPVSIWGVTVADFRQQDQVIPADQVQMYRQARVSVQDYPTWYLRLTPNLREPREFPDPLIPLTAPKGALPIDIEPGRCAAIWSQIHVPTGMEPGKYRSVIRVTTGSGEARKLNLVLLVWPFAIPNTRHLAMIAGIDTAAVLGHHLEVNGRPYAPTRLSFDDPAYERAVAILDESTRLIHRHRCSPILRDIRPVRRVGVNGQLELDWVDYDRLVAGILDGSAFDDRTSAAAWPMPIDDHDPSPDAYGGWDSPTYNRMFIDYLRQCVAHFDQQDWLNRNFVCIPLPGPSYSHRFQQFQQLGRLIQQTDARVNLVCQLPPQSMEPYGWREAPFQDVSSFVGTWCPPVSLSDPDELAKQRAAGKRSWLQPDRPPYSGSLSLIAPGVDARCIAWQAYRFAYDGVLLPIINDWKKGEHDEIPAPCPSESERALIWPGKPYGLDRPIPSIRLKRLLRGAQDYEYLWLLEKNRRPGIAKLIAADLFPYAGTACYGEHFLDGQARGWISDPVAWSLARRLMARELIAAINAAGADGAEVPEDIDRFEQQIEWARLINAVRKVRSSVEGIRVHITPEDQATPLHIEATISLFNATRKAFAGRLAFADLPEEWTAAEPAQPIVRLEPARGARWIVRAKTPSVQANSDGVLPVRIALTGDKATVTDDYLSEARGRLCVLTSHRVAGPIVIDGKLDDWPLGTTNVAGDFVLVGALDVPKRGRPSPDRASQPTTVFVCNNDEYLFIAFNCQDDRLADRQITQSNFVRYDELWPTGEDLVEVILDPTNQAVDPGDLLHITVKANGAVITERGVQCLDRVAKYAPWPINVTAAINDNSQPDRWTVEIRIPLESLGKKASVWGINFARFCARLGEYASWTGARRYLYSPVTLGNMRLGP